MEPLIGHETVWKFLTHAQDTDQVAHAYLFVGPPHVGKRHVAEQFARRWLCSATEEKPCGRCESCNALQKGLHPDFILLTRAEDEQGILIEATRQFLSRLKQSPSLSSRKIAVIDPAETMNSASANAFLKQLEEPTPSTTLILIAHDKQKLLSTIASRCQIIEFDRVRQPSALAADKLYARAQGLPGLYVTYKRSPSLAQQAQDEAEAIWLLFDMTPGQRLAYLESFFGKKKTPHSQLKDDWDKRLQSWQDGLRQRVVTGDRAATGITWPGYVMLCDDIQALRKGLQQNINVRLHLERFCLRMDAARNR